MRIGAGREPFILKPDMSEGFVVGCREEDRAW